MNNWANVGDLVFILSRDNEPIPCKVIKELGTGVNAQLFFEPIEDSDKGKIAKNRLKAYINQVGFAGGYVFRKKQNALDYLESIKNGSFNMGSIITQKAKRVQKDIILSSQPIDIQKIKDEATEKAVIQVHKTVIAAMLLALNSMLGIGPKRGTDVVNEINRLIEEVGAGNMTQKELVELAEKKMKIKIEGSELS